MVDVKDRSVGDVVRLKSGGPSMTVVAKWGDGDQIAPISKKGAVRCCWMGDDGKADFAEFDLRTLVDAKPPA